MCVCMNVCIYKDLQNALHTLSHLVRTTIHNEGAIIVPIL